VPLTSFKASASHRLFGGGDGLCAQFDPRHCELTKRLFKCFNELPNTAEALAAIFSAIGAATRFRNLTANAMILWSLHGIARK
jgi:hypothetical protein